MIIIKIIKYIVQANKYSTNSVGTCEDRGTDFRDHYGNCHCKVGFTGGMCQMCEVGHTGNDCDICEEGFVKDGQTCIGIIVYSNFVS